MREDYSPGGTAWDYFPHDHARSRVYRWNEDGLFGISDQHQHVCFALALWNRRDPILKERLFGLNNSEGNHGEDVKECYFYLDNVPTHSYMKALYKYPQAAYPYGALLAENRRRGRSQPEFELPDTGVFAENRYWDVLVEYAKASPEDVLIQITVTNRGPDEAPLDLLPTVWFRNRWSWDPGAARPAARRGRSGPAGPRSSSTVPTRAGGISTASRTPSCSSRRTRPISPASSARANPSPFVKDAFHELLIHDRRDAVNPDKRGTKAAALHRLHVPAGGSARVRLRLSPTGRTAAIRSAPTSTPCWQRAVKDADEFYATVIPPGLSADAANVMRQALAGLLWSKQYFHYDVLRWLEGDPTEPAPPAEPLARPQPRVDAPLRRRRHLDAGQVGVPVVCGLGPGLSLRDARHGRCAASPRSSSCSCCASGTCTRTGRRPRTSGPSAT